MCFTWTFANGFGPIWIELEKVENQLVWKKELAEMEKVDNQLVCKKGEWTCHRMQISLPSKPSSALTRATRHDQHARRLRQSDPLRDATHDLKTCAYCLQEKPKMKKCAGCRWARYCNRGCQRAHWLLHRQTCCPDHCLPIGQLGILMTVIRKTALTDCDFP